MNSLNTVLRVLVDYYSTRGYLCFPENSFVSNHIYFRMYKNDKGWIIPIDPSIARQFSPVEMLNHIQTQIEECLHKKVIVFNKYNRNLPIWF